MYMQELDAHPVFDRDYERRMAISEAIEDGRAIIKQQTVAEAADLNTPVSDTLDHLTWLMTGDDEAGAAVRRYGRLPLEEFEDLCRASDKVWGADMAELAAALDEYLDNYYGG